ncbi:MAG: PQQ-binding-like beta-propeller repeat protein, partial [Myxococcota bacterium]
MPQKIAWLYLVLPLVWGACSLVETEGSSTVGAAVDSARILAADATPGEWLSHGRTYGEQRFSPLDEINTDSVAGLGLAFYADLPTKRGIEATPLMVDGKLFLTASWGHILAYDARTGEE